MKNISLYLCALFLVGFFAAEAEALTYSDSPSWYTGLIGKSQNQILEPKPLGDISRLPKLAKVHFIVDSNDKLGFDNIEQSFDHDNINRCKALGFNKTGACGSNQRVSRYCPYDNSYYDQCCDMNFAYSKGECSYPNTISGNSCGGKFKCYCDRSLYPYTSCEAPKVNSSDKCADVTYTNGSAVTNVYYAACVCPSGYRTCGTNQIGLDANGNDGGACSEDGVAKYAGCRCKDGYALTCSEYGPKNPGDFCLIGTKYYKECKTINDVCTEELKNKYPSYNVVQGECGKYEKQVDTCSKDGSFKVCQPTCKSQIAGDSRYGIDSNGFIYSVSSPSTAYVVEDSQIVPLINSNTGSTYTNIYGPDSLKSAASLCGSAGRPTIKVNTTQNQYVLSRSFTGVNLELLNDTYYINSNAYWNDVSYSGKTYLTLRADGSNARINIYSDLTSGRTVSIYATNQAYISLNADTNLSTLSLSGGAQAYVGGGGNNTISSLTVDGGGSKASLSYSKNLNISSASVTNGAVIQADDSGSSGRTYKIGTLRVTNSGIFKTNYIKPFQITDLYMQERGRVKVGTMGQVRVSGTIYMNTCGRMCTYSGYSKSEKGIFYYKNSDNSGCWPNPNSCTIFYTGNSHWPMTESGFNYSKCYNKKYLGDRWLTRGSGARGKEMCGASYSDDTITNEHC